MKWCEKTKKWTTPIYTCSKCKKTFDNHSNFGYHTINKICEKDNASKLFNRRFTYGFKGRKIYL
uniref:C2H2-type domain-containing protein n=1 Tax=viral metagenome TaxID=1070528 RepID=A0A6C0J826_9ZZZZ